MPSRILAASPKRSTKPLPVSRNAYINKRRLDGLKFAGIDAKAKTLPGSAAAWPIGADLVQDFPNAAINRPAPERLPLVISQRQISALRDGNQSRPCRLPCFRGNTFSQFQNPPAKGFQRVACGVFQYRPVSFEQVRERMSAVTEAFSEV